MRLLDKIAIVTGAGGGIGRAAAVRFASEGATVFAADINEDGIRKQQSCLMPSSHWP